MKILVTGGAGFIGSALSRRLIADARHDVVVLDKLTYAASLDALASVADASRFTFVKGDICDAALVSALLAEHRIEAVMHLAAESHVDRSIDGPAAFVETNIVGAYVLLDAALQHWTGRLDRDPAFRFLHVSTDEVFGDLAPDAPRFDETSAYAPSSPYSASKAAADHLARAWRRTYGLPVLVTNCSNNYGPFHFPEKLIPLVILNALEFKPLPVFGDGANIRDWLHVEDHVDALIRVLDGGRPGETYAVGGDAERTNLEVVQTICDLLDARVPGDRPRRSLIAFVPDRPGHDRRYAIDAGKLRRELGWRPRYDFETGLAATVDWHLNNEGWWRPIRERRYAGERLGQR